MQRPLEGRVALVTGAGTRLGKAIALKLASLGADIVVHYFQSSEGAQTVVDAIKVDGNRAASLRADLSTEAEKVISEASGLIGPLSILVNSAAVFGPRYSADEFWKVNARAPWLLSQTFAELPSAKDIVNILDIGGVLNHWKEEIAYTMSKAAAAEMTRCCALKYADRIRVNGVAPGAVLLPVDMSSEHQEKILQRIPQGRFGQADDVAETVAMLLCAPKFMTGQIVAVDGGRSLA